MKWMEAIRKHWLLFMIAAFLLPLLLIRLAFSDTLSRFFGFDAKWGAADMLSYCMSYMSMLGTLFLGFATHRQAHLLNETEQRMERHTHMSALSERQPAVLLLNGRTTDTKNILAYEVSLAKVNYDASKMELINFIGEEADESFTIRLTFVNSSKTFLEMRYIVLSIFEDWDYIRPMDHFGNEDFYASLAPGEKMVIALEIGQEYKKQILDRYYQMAFELYNSIGERYLEQVQFASTNVTSKRKQSIQYGDAIDTVAFDYKYYTFDYDKNAFEAL